MHHTFTAHKKIIQCPVPGRPVIKLLFFSILYFSKSNFSASTCTAVHHSSLDGEEGSLCLGLEKVI